MRLKYDDPSDGNERIRSRFLFFPRYIQGEARWLERAKWLQRYDTNYADDGWKDVSWYK